MHRRELAGLPREDGPPPLPDGVSGDSVLRPDDGAGPLFHRRYSVRISDARMSAPELMARVQADPNDLAPTEFARFVKVEGTEGRMGVGDEYVVRMPGPWDGPVRVVVLTPASFRLVTLHGHLEAGQIEFRAADGDELEFTIESWARSGDQLSNVMYKQLRMAKEVQLHMWTSFLERVVKLSGGRRSGAIEIDTRKVDEDALAGERLLGDPSARPLLDSLHLRELNFDLGRSEAFTPENGWRVDDHCQALPSEPPGPPVPGGSWEVARRLVGDYEFADPSIVRAVYYPDRPLDQRDMLLVVRFWGLRFRIGVRVGGVTDETHEVDGRRVRVWGWNYRTLHGHLEMGQIDYEVWKWLDTGEVEFRIRAFSRWARLRNPVVALGLRLFGRREQLRFADNALERVASLTAAALRESQG